MILWICIVLGLMILCSFSWMRIEASGYRLRHEEMASNRIPESFHNFKILLITDIHRRKLSERKLQMLVHNQKLDCVLIGGDITERGVPVDRVRANLEVLRQLAPVYAVLGNHDLNAGHHKLDRLFNQPGLTLLKDRTIMIDREGESIALSGMMQPASRKHPYSNFKGRSKQGQFHIVLVHDPIWIEEQRKLSADLILAGHTHGGQVIVPLLGAVRLEGFYKKYNAGWYDLFSSSHSIRMLISRGFGTSHIPLRLGCPSELHLITLLKKP